MAVPASDAPVERCDVVGPICETGDRFAEQRPLPPVKPGDLVAFATAGAYGAVMSSTYNTRLPAAEVLVRGDRFDVVRPRPSYDHIIDLDKIPDWLAEGQLAHFATNLPSQLNRGLATLLTTLG